MSGSVAVAGRPRPASGARSWVLATVEDLARSDPDRVALVSDEGPVGYAELWERARTEARGLGSRPGVVAVPALHHPDTVASLLAVWIAGGTYCPVDPAYPPDHAAALLAAIRGLADERVAYVLFTSGSTGRPKPVAVPHRALDAVVPALGELFGIVPGDRVLQFSSLSWDTQFEELLPTLAAGASVVFGRDAHSGSLSRMLRLVEQREVSVLNLPTAMWHELVLHLTESGAALPERVRLVVIGGEAVNPARLAAWRALPGTDRVRLLNTYGATETVLVTHAVDLHGPLAAGATIAAEPPPIGWPLAHVHQQLTAAGELLVAGPSLAAGYLGLPEPTAERFVELHGVRWFRTGDLVREGAHGLLHPLGRLDAQVKVRGIRVDPGEVEAHLLRGPGVAAAAVTGVTLSGRTALAAYVVPDDPRTMEAPDALVAAILAHLRAHAPGHLRPARLTIVPALVLTTSGKADRRATHERYATS